MSRISPAQLTAQTPPVKGVTLSGRRASNVRGAADSGAVTAEYAIATMAAVGFAGLLVVILRSDAVRAMLTEMVNRALTFAG